MASDGLITLSSKGMEIAEKIYERHKVLTSFFISIGVDPEIAREDACQIEHDLHQETFEALCRHAENI
jgi:Mn-dependent DtxR family transcriptional regulator